MSYFFNDILCNEEFLKPNKFTKKILSNFITSFKAVNYQNNKLEIVEDGDFEDADFRITDLNLQGKEYIWKLL